MIAESRANPREWKTKAEWANTGSSVNNGVKAAYCQIEIVDRTQDVGAGRSPSGSMLVTHEFGLSFANQAQKANEPVQRAAVTLATRRSTLVHSTSDLARDVYSFATTVFLTSQNRRARGNSVRMTRALILCSLIGTGLPLSVQ